MSAPADVAVIGGGPIGLAIAWRCAQRGLRVALHDPAPPTGAGAVSPHAGAVPLAADSGGAWRVSAGMLAPVSEAHFGEAELTRLLVESAARWPGFAAELAGSTGLELGHRTEGTLAVALTADDLAEVERLRAYQAGLGLPIERVLASELREREPLLSPRLRGGAYAPRDHQVDPRRLMSALRAAVGAAGIPVRQRVVADLDEVDAAVTVVAAGCGSAALAGLPVRPVKGQILRLRAPGGAEPGFRHVLRGYADGRPVYLVPRLGGEVVVGATVEERGDGHATAGAVLDLLRAATDLVPELTEYELAEVGVGHRPGTPDNAPILGPYPGRPGLVVATGHHRHGIVLTPVTADLIAELVHTGVAPPALAPFSPARFTPADLGTGAQG